MKIFLKHQNNDYSINNIVRNMYNTSKERYSYVQFDNCMVSSLNGIFGREKFEFLAKVGGKMQSTSFRFVLNFVVTAGASLSS